MGTPMEKLREMRSSEMAWHLDKRINSNQSVDSKTVCSIDKEKELFDEVKYGNKDKVCLLLDEIFNDMLSSGLKEKLIETRCLEIAIMSSRTAIEGGVSLEATLHLNDQLIKEINRPINLKKKFELTKSFINRYINLLHKKNKLHKPEIIQKVKEFINYNYADKLSLDQIANHIYLSTSYLSKIFKEGTGKTVIEHLTKVRLREAKRLLRETEKPLKKIAKWTGYYDASYFSKVFKKKIGVTPGQYRINDHRSNW
ncbi:AraC family transcriptional regulator [Selenihalanaerobacter shriftii]|uniref:AraC-type DNA-binding protein n=1 Tax=Selenihalanaerobacter shriftii TaxID=142842 RepID=A0A1T4MQL2_9FIRM|nr:AraC family transcriptional regulator [Selenihalanaerobacter shriftii]SJZ69302.1 AraC-type DNA-binding protein [Selenihalanaerobacter shriftii]